MNDKVFTILYRLKDMRTMRTTKLMSFRESCRFNGFTIAFFVVRNKIIPLPVLFVGYNSREFINLEFLVLRRVRIIEVPLFEWNISTDEI